MKKHPYLGQLRDAITHRLDRLLQLCSNITGRQVSAEEDRNAAYVMIEALSAWSSFIREYFLSCALLEPKAVGGTKITHSRGGVIDEHTAMLEALNATGKIHAYRRSAAQGRVTPRDEPTWHEPTTLVRISTWFSLSNDALIAASISYPTSFFTEAPTIRNFYAHRNHGSADKVRAMALRQYGLLALDRPTVLVSTLFSARSQTLLEEWLQDLKKISHDLCQ